MVQVDVCPILSSAVNVTVTGVPTLLQLKLEISMLKDGVSKSSVEPLLISLAVIVALPVASNCTVKVLI